VNKISHVALTVLLVRAQTHSSNAHAMQHGLQLLLKAIDKTGR